MIKRQIYINLSDGLYRQGCTLAAPTGDIQESQFCIKLKCMVPCRGFQVTLIKILPTAQPLH